MTSLTPLEISLFTKNNAPKNVNKDVEISLYSKEVIRGFLYGCNFYCNLFVAVRISKQTKILKYSDNSYKKTFTATNDNFLNILINSQQKYLGYNP